MEKQAELNQSSLLVTLAITIVITILTSITTVVLMGGFNPETAKTPENYPITRPAPSSTSKFLDVMQDQARGNMNAAEDLDELQQSYDRPVVDLEKYLPQ